MEPLMIDRAGAKLPWLNVVKFYLKLIPCLPKIIANRPSVVYPKVREAGEPFAVGTLVFVRELFGP